jgi:hypothetical protein
MDAPDVIIRKRLKRYAAMHHPPANGKMRLLQAASHASSGSLKIFDRKPTLTKRFSEVHRMSPWFALPFDLQNPYSLQWGIASRML